MKSIASEAVKGKPFCQCCGGEEDVLDLVIGWETLKEARYAHISSTVRIAMCEGCRYNLAHKLEDS